MRSKAARSALIAVLSAGVFGGNSRRNLRANLVPAEPAGVLLGWVTEIPLPGSEKQPGRPVRPRAGGPRRFQRSRGPSVVRPDDGPWFSDPRPGGAACHPEVPANTAESCCVPSSAAAGHACGPCARAARARRPRIIEALTRARVSQLLSLLRLAPEILEYIDGLDGTEGGLHLTARRLRDIPVLDDPDAQRARFRALVGDTVAPSGRASTVVTPRGGDRSTKQRRQPRGRAKR